jgi:Domain of unknown function (DUF1877)
MGMVWNMLRVSDEELEMYKNDSELLMNRVYEQESDEDDPALTYLDKAWDGIHFLLTGATIDNANHPLTKIFVNEQILDEEQDMGYGPAMYLTPEEVVEIHQQLETIEMEAFRQRFDAEKMTDAGIYPNIWDHSDALEYLEENFLILKSTFSMASNKQEALISFMS